jgi:hypothetical protein
MTQLFQSLGVAVVVAVLGFLAATYWWQKNAAVKEADRLAAISASQDRRIADMEGKILLLNQHVMPLSAAYQAFLIHKLTHFHTPVMDKLMVKLTDGTISPEEKRDLIRALKERESDMGEAIDDAERDAARMLPMVMKQVEADAVAMHAAQLELKLVSVVPNTGPEHVG